MRTSPPISSGPRAGSSFRSPRYAGAMRRVVGWTAYWRLRFWPGRSDLCAIEIGWTWLAASAQRTGLNVEAKMLLFEYAFESLGVVSVDLKTEPATNCPAERSNSLALISKASFAAGPNRTLPRRKVSFASPRFSVILPEWPAVRSSLRRRRPTRPVHDPDWTLGDPEHRRHNPTCVTFTEAQNGTSGVVSVHIHTRSGMLRMMERSRFGSMPEPAAGGHTGIGLRRGQDGLRRVSLQRRLPVPHRDDPCKPIPDVTKTIGRRTDHNPSHCDRARPWSTQGDSSRNCRYACETLGLHLT